MIKYLNAMKAFLAKGGKITKLPPGKAQGYHGKDDPGKDMHGMMAKGDTKAPKSAPTGGGGGGNMVALAKNIDDQQYIHDKITEAGYRAYQTSFGEQR